MRNAHEWPTLVGTISEAMELTEVEYYEAERMADQDTVRCEHPHAGTEQHPHSGARRWVCPDCGAERDLH